MKKALLLLAVAAAAVLVAAPRSAEAGRRARLVYTVIAASPTSGSAPTTDCDVANSSAPVASSALCLRMVGCKSIYVCTSIANGSHLGGGQLDAYGYDEDLGTSGNRWAREGGADLKYDATCTGVRCCFVSNNLNAGWGGGFWNLNAVTHNGTAVTLTAQCLD